ncbi:transglycosylase SLT domain-containing protein [Dickeya fangzhongdai]|uniref:transglycosylase SLT domain-containing protein n=1 Tax=Dickeya fangzhongdai TaxID=1778540 RepID=UPI000907D63C|nr:transglycosylase SLT domain-containing protein [Dickeya fangzhongdai]
MATPTIILRWLMAVLLTVTKAHAQEIPPPAYQLSAQRFGIPSTVLYAIALQESGILLHGRLVPWPWSLNIAGKPHRYNSQARTCVTLQQAINQVPLTRIDVGLAQINLGYQRHRYSSPCDLLNPYQNLAIAAGILKEQYKPDENWLHAVGRYHHPAGGKLADHYQCGVARHLARMPGTLRLGITHENCQQ